MINITEINVDKTITYLIIKYKNRNRKCCNFNMKKMEELIKKQDSNDKELHNNG